MVRKPIPRCKRSAPRELAAGELREDVLDVNRLPAEDGATGCGYPVSPDARPSG